MENVSFASNVAIIGIDPAPAKGAVVCYESPEGMHLESWPANEVKAKLMQWCDTAKMKWNKEKILITWDAPLTGPYSTSNIENMKFRTNFTQRVLDKLFSAKENKGYRPPSGITVSGYGSCFHWTISQYVLGLPKISEYHTQSLFPLATADTESFVASYQNIKEDTLIAEVHPALGMWLFLKEAADVPAWKYKGGGRKLQERIKLNRKILIEKMKGKFEQFLPEQFISTKKIFADELSDDALDAWMAWLLGKLWVLGDAAKMGESAVGLVGTQSTGAMLLPYATDLAKLLKEVNATCMSGQTKSKVKTKAK